MSLPTQLSTSTIITGSGLIYIGKTATSALPTHISDSTTGALVWDTTGTTGWTAISLTTDGIVINTDSKTDDVKVDQSTSVIKKFLSEESVSVEFKIPYNDLTAFNIAIAGGTYSEISASAGVAGQTQFTVGDGTLAELPLCYVAKSESGYDRLYHFFKTVKSGKVKMTQNKKANEIAVSMDVIADMSQPAGARLYKVYNIVTLAS